MARQGSVELEGVVTECLPNTLFRVKLTDQRFEKLKGKIVLCHLSGKMRIYYIRILPGDSVKIELTPYDLTKGRIVYRAK